MSDGQNGGYRATTVPQSGDLYLQRASVMELMRCEHGSKEEGPLLLTLRLERSEYRQGDPEQQRAQRVQRLAVVGRNSRGSSLWVEVEDGG